MLYQPAYGQTITDFLVADTITGTFSIQDLPPGYRAAVTNTDGSFDARSLIFAPADLSLVAANTPNQQNVANALNTFIGAGGDMDAVISALDPLPAAQYPQAFDQIAPGFYQTVRDIALGNLTGPTRQIGQRLGAQRLNDRGFDPEHRWNVWTMAQGLYNKNDPLAALPGYNFARGGNLVGADYRWNPRLRTGVLLGGQAGEGDYPGASSLRMSEADFGLYAAYDAGNGLYSTALGLVSRAHYSAHRGIDFGTLHRVAHSTFDSTGAAVYLETGYDFKAGNFRFGPVLDIQYSYAGIAPLTETNAGSLNLSLRRQDLDSLQTNLGARVAYLWNLGNGVQLAPEIRAFWNREHLNNADRLAASLNGGSGAAFTYAMPEAQQDSLFAGAGVSARFGAHWDAGVYYNLSVTTRSSVSHLVSASLSYGF